MMSSTPTDDDLDGNAAESHLKWTVEDPSAPSAGTDPDRKDGVKLPSNGVERVGLFASLDMTASFNRWFSSSQPKSGAATSRTPHLLDEEDHPSLLFRNKDYVDLQTPLPLVDNLENCPRQMSCDTENQIHPTIRLLDESSRPRSHSECWHHTESFSTEEGSTTSTENAPPLHSPSARLRSRAYTADPTTTGGRLRRRFGRSQEIDESVRLNCQKEEEHSLLLRPLAPTSSFICSSGQDYISSVDIRTDDAFTEEINNLPANQDVSNLEALDDIIFMPPSHTERAHINTAARSSHQQMHSDILPSTGDFEETQSSSIVAPDEMNDRERLARMRWIRINRRFQTVIAVVALLFSLLLFSIVLCWVALTVAIALSWNQDCDVPLKPYYWLVTLQLILDIFRSDIMRFLFRWDNRSSERIPGRVVAYNCVYILYALLVLRLGVNSVINTDEMSMCHETAPRLFRTSLAFVSLTIAAWITIVCGYVIPFLIVAILLTANGYNPYSDSFSNAPGNGSHSTSFPVIPTAFASTGAPPGCVDQLRVRSMNDCPSSECCICMDVFAASDVVVETNCGHYFHKSCCREWLRQSKTCPVCRDDIPASLPEAPKWSRRRDPPLPESSPGGSSHSTNLSSNPMESWRQVWEATRNSWHDRTATSSSHLRAEREREEVSSRQWEGTIILDDTATDVEIGRSVRAISADLYGECPNHEYMR